MSQDDIDYIDRRADESRQKASAANDDLVRRTHEKFATACDERVSHADREDPLPVNECDYGEGCRVSPSQWSIRSLQALYAEFSEELCLNYQSGGPSWAAGHRNREQLAAMATQLEVVGQPVESHEEWADVGVVDIYHFRKGVVVAF